MSTELETRAKAVKEYEVRCYQICFYILQNEAKALQAALACVEALLLNDSFFKMQVNEQQEAVRKASIRYSLKQA
ncbi:hypothetical protein [Paenibacillus sp. UNC451MF]|uniref:hypothetical protein n=1 Tax=Paenibacillus sp. UNC451MF TaxID=1449063 RepID=UPI000A65A17E|nr:hypothetical protein [Paenibacillus sp. UNC451MF]